MEIVFTAQVVINEFLPGPHQPGRVFVFSDNLSWKSIDATTMAGVAGTHSGTHQTRRHAEPDDGVLVTGIIVWEYEATFVLNAVTFGGAQLDAGQVTARGVWYSNEGGQLVDAQGQPVNERRYAVTGGTGPYSHVRGEGFEPADGHIKTLEIEL